MNPSVEADSTPAHFGPREEKSYSLVLLSGLVTTALALLGVYLLDTRTDDFHIMGWYADYVIPIGALIVGVVASSGYGLGSWFSGIKITRSLLGMVLTLQLVAYFGALYIEFRSLHLIHRRDGTPVGFFEYYDLTARSFAWKDDKGGQGEPLGVWGYAFRGLEVIGFVAGGLIVPAVMRKAPYCPACQRYMRSRQIGVLPAAVPVRKVKKSDAAGLEAYQTEKEQALEKGKRTWEQLRQLALESKAADFQKVLAELEPSKKATAKLPLRLVLKLVSCGRCQSGWLQCSLLSVKGRNVTQTEVGRAEVLPEFVRSLKT